MDERRGRSMTGMRTVSVLALACMLGAGGARAQTVPTPVTTQPTTPSPTAQTHSQGQLRGKPPSPSEVPHTMQQALAVAYATNPTLQTARAQLRAADENVPQALAGWRPTLVVGAEAGRAYGAFGEVGPTGAPVSVPYNQTVEQVQATLTQPIYTGGKVPAQLHHAKNLVVSTRAQLLATEEQVLFNSAQAYVTVVQDEQLLQIDIGNEQILTKQLQSTNDRFRVGELTRTDVAQAEAALAAATATRETAEGTLQAARATYEELIGEPAEHLSTPQPLKLPVQTVDEANRLADKNNPNVVAALFNDAAARDNFDVAYAALMPTVGVQVTAIHNRNIFGPGFSENGGLLLGTLNLPIYQGGAEYSAIRQARQQEIQARKQLEDQRRTAVQQATAAWEQLAAARASIVSNRASVRANEIAVEGLEREALVGSATTLDVLIQVQTLLQAQTALVQSLAQLVTSSYQVAQAVGRLTARDLNLNVPLYDDTAYYKAVKDLWIGTGDYATQQPGR
jgi:outer membrane protein